MRRKYLIFVMHIVFILLSASVAFAEKRMFVFAGQSNMVGMARTYDFPGEYQSLPSNIVMYVEGSAKEFRASGKRQGWGPEISFAREMAKRCPDDTIIIVKYAVGATSLYGWRKDWSESGGLTANDRKAPHYSKLMALVRDIAAKEQVKPSAFFWLQGEADHNHGSTFSEYRDMFSMFIRDIRKDLGAEYLPFIFGRLQRYEYAARSEVRDAQDAVSSSAGNTKMVTTDDLRRIDRVHYDAEGLILIGKRFAEAYLGFANRTVLPK
jgi:hypothetical protein